MVLKCQNDTRRKPQRLTILIKQSPSTAQREYGVVTSPFLHAEGDGRELDALHALVCVHDGRGVGLVQVQVQPRLDGAEPHAGRPAEYAGHPEQAAHAEGEIAARFERAGFHASLTGTFL